MKIRNGAHLCKAADLVLGLAEVILVLLLFLVAPTGLGDFLLETLDGRAHRVEIPSAVLGLTLHLLVSPFELAQLLLFHPELHLGLLLLGARMRLALFCFGDLTHIPTTGGTVVGRGQACH